MNHLREQERERERAEYKKKNKKTKNKKKASRKKWMGASVFLIVIVAVGAFHFNYGLDVFVRMSSRFSSISSFALSPSLSYFLCLVVMLKDIYINVRVLFVHVKKRDWILSLLLL